MKTRRKKASTPFYVSPSQLTLVGFESPFSKKLNPKNRWILLANQIPWDSICNIYSHHVGISTTGRPPLSPRIVLGSLIIKHICNLDDRETIDQISENMYMQYFLGYDSFTTEVPFDASLFVDFRHRIGLAQIDLMNQQIYLIHQKLLAPKEEKTNKNPSDEENIAEVSAAEITHKGRVLMDATACPQNIAYPTDINLLSDAREKTEEIIDKIHGKSLHKKKPRTYRQNARKEYLKIAQKKRRTNEEIQKSKKKQLGYLKRNLASIDKMIESNDFSAKNLGYIDLKYIMVCHTLYAQQEQMYLANSHQVADRIVSIHQPHVRPIVRGKSTANVEFGSKIHISLVDGFTFLDELSWDAYNEGSHMMAYVENYKKRIGYYPKEILADQIYCTRENRRKLKLLGISLLAKPLGRPTALNKEYVRPGERNPVEGKFGQAKTAYGLGCIKARLRDTSEFWVAFTLMVLNLVKLARVALSCLIFQLLNTSFSAYCNEVIALSKIRMRMQNANNLILIKI